MHTLKYTSHTYIKYTSKVEMEDRYTSLVKTCIPEGPWLEKSSSRVFTYFEWEVCLGHVPSSFLRSMTSTWGKNKAKTTEPP